MNTVDYIFEKTSDLKKAFIVGIEEISFKKLYNASLNLEAWLQRVKTL